MSDGLDLARYKVLSFDCYGTLIDWEAGLIGVLGPWAREQGLNVGNQELLLAYADSEAEIERERPTARYPDVLAAAFRRTGEKLGREVSDERAEQLGQSVPDWPAFPDSAAALARLLTHDHQQAASGDEDEAVAASPWAATDGFQFTGSRLLTLPIAVDGEAKDATVAYGKDGMKVSVDGELPAADAKAFVSNGDVYVVRSGRQTRVRLQDFSAAAAQSTGGDGTVRAPMHGRLLSLFVRAGDAVEPGQRLAVIEAMKMEHTLRAPIAGIVTEVAVGEGAQVVEAAKILVIAPDKPG